MPRSKTNKANELSSVKQSTDTVRDKGIEQGSTGLPKAATKGVKTPTISTRNRMHLARSNVIPTVTPDRHNYQLGKKIPASSGKLSNSVKITETTASFCCSESNTEDLDNADVDHRVSKNDKLKTAAGQRGSGTPPSSVSKADRSQVRMSPPINSPLCKTPPRSHTTPPGSHTTPPGSHTTPPGSHTTPPRSHTTSPGSHAGSLEKRARGYEGVYVGRSQEEQDDFSRGFIARGDIPAYSSNDIVNPFSIKRQVQSSNNIERYGHAAARSGGLQATTVSSAAKGTVTVVVKSLASFGVVSTNKYTPSLPFNTSLLRCTVVYNLDHYVVIYRVEGLNWVERVWYIAIASREEWVASWNFKNYQKSWVHEQEPQINAKGFPVRLFLLPVADKPSQETLLDMGRYICDCLSNAQGNSNKIIVQEDNFFWLDDTVVWADILGHRKACDELKELQPQQAGGQGFFQRNKDLISCFFHLNDIPRDIAEEIGAPLQKQKSNLQKGSSAFAGVVSFNRPMVSYDQDLIPPKYCEDKEDGEESEDVENGRILNEEAMTYNVSKFKENLHSREGESGPARRGTVKSEASRSVRRAVGGISRAVDEVVTQECEFEYDREGVLCENELHDLETQEVFVYGQNPEEDVSFPQNSVVFKTEDDLGMFAESESEEDEFDFPCLKGAVDGSKSLSGESMKPINNVRKIGQRNPSKVANPYKTIKKSGTRKTEDEETY